ncbi:MAG TPA: epoxyqueuosine reductase QueH, partial [Candidatus Nanoarchaeia archaeon]|nr:epoxyqueuosine reductase QueH [Candidatus Nanoarchaeia archaeon]
MRVLLHTCCGPCAVFPLDLLKKNEVEIYFYNPNVYPAEEYKKRKETVQQVAKKYGWSFSEGKYEPNVWQTAVKGYEHEPENSQ